MSYQPTKLRFDPINKNIYGKDCCDYISRFFSNKCKYTNKCKNVIIVKHTFSVKGGPNTHNCGCYGYVNKSDLQD